MIRLVVLAIVSLVFVSAARAEQPPATEAATASRSAMPNEYRMNLMIRTTIVALNQANQTGNYSVLRDLGTPAFQQVNSATKLSEIFADLRNRGVDLSPTLFFDPKLVRPPAIQPNGRLRLSGYFETRPQQVNFDLSFEPVGNDWRLFGIAVEVGAPRSAVPSKAGEAPDQTPAAATVTKPDAPRPTAPTGAKPGPMSRDVGPK